MNKLTMEQTMTVLMTMDMPRDKKLILHLAQHFGTPRQGLFRACKQAIMLDALGFDWDTTEVKLPEYISFLGQQTATMRKLIELNHLQWFLTDTEDNGRLMSEVGFTIDLESQSNDVPKDSDETNTDLGDWE
jgi:hypothetical protein